MRSRLLATALAAAAALAFTPAAAHAGETYWFTTEGKPLPDFSKGFTRASVTVEWLNKKTYDLSGWVEDVCPKDGNGAYLWINPSIAPLAKDTNGCGDGRKYFDPPPVVSGSIVRSLGMSLCERDMDGTGHGTNYCTAHTFYNWRV